MGLFSELLRGVVMSRQLIQLFLQRLLIELKQKELGVSIEGGSLWEIRLTHWRSKENRIEREAEMGTKVIHQMRFRTLEQWPSKRYFESAS